MTLYFLLTGGIGFVLPTSVVNCALGSNISSISRSAKTLRRRALHNLPEQFAPISGRNALPGS